MFSFKSVVPKMPKKSRMLTTHHPLIGHPYIWATAVFEELLALKLLLSYEQNVVERITALKISKIQIRNDAAQKPTLCLSVWARTFPKNP
jgi:hypothetical protein